MLSCNVRCLSNCVLACCACQAQVVLLVPVGPLHPLVCHPLVSPQACPAQELCAPQGPWQCQVRQHSSGIDSLSNS
jgi:hypothetical protein